MNKKNHSGVVLKANDFKENAQIISLFTPNGKESLIVRGAKKINSKTRIFAQPLTLISYRKTLNRELNTLIEGEVIDSFSSIKADQDKMNVVYPILEKLYLFGNETKDDQVLFEFIIMLLDLLKNTKFSDVLLVIFEVKLLYLLGLAPRFFDCPSCGKKLKVGYFSIEAGGVLCELCSHFGFNLDRVQTEALKQLYLIKPEKIDEQFLQKHFENIEFLQLIIDDYYLKYLDFKSKSKKIITQLKAQN